MPEIREYTQQVGGASELPLGQVTRQAFASDFTGAGQGLQHVGQALQQVSSDGIAIQRMVQEQQARKEVTQAHIELAGLNAEAAKELDRIQNSPDVLDDAWAEQFNARWSTQLDNVSSKYNTAHGQQAFDRGAADFRAHYLVESARVQSNLAGVQAVDNFKQYIEASRNALLSNPLQFERLEKDSINLLSDPNGVFANIPANKRTELMRYTRESLAVSAVQGVIQKDPELALAKLQLGDWGQYLDGDKTHQLMVEAQVGINGLDAEARRREAEQERLRKLEIKNTQNQFISLLDSDKLTSEMILNSNLDPVGEGSKEHYLNIIRARAKEHKEKPIQQDPKIYLNVLQGIRSGEITDETQIEQVFAMSAQNRKGITWEDTKSLRKEFEERRTPSGRVLGDAIDSFVKKHQAAIDRSNPVMGIKDELGTRKLGQFNDFILHKVEEYRQEKKNPHDLFDESKPDYIGKPEIIDRYRTTTMESIHSKAESARRGMKPKITPPGFVEKMKRAFGLAEDQTTLEPGNIDLDKRPVVKNKDGSVSTLRSMSFNIDGKEVLLPTIAPDGSQMTPDEAVARYRETGEHLGIYSSPEAATEAAKKLSQRQEKFSDNGLRQQKEAVEGIKKSAKQMEDFAASLPGKPQPPVEPRKHGESAEDYLKRREQARGGK